MASKEGKRQELVDAVYRAAYDAAVTLGRPKLPAIPKTAGKRNNRKEEAALLHTTDWQCGKLTASYNMEVCAQRVKLAVEKTIRFTEIQRADHPVGTCHLLLGGDMVEGVSIFPGQPWEVEAGAYEQIFAASSLIEWMVLRLAGEFDRVVVDDVPGNHGRMGRRGDHPTSDNLDRILYRIARDRLSEVKNVEWELSDGWHRIVPIGGRYRALLAHGDEVGGAVSTVEREVVRWAAGVIEPFTDAYIGHRHHCQEFALPVGSRRVFMTPSTESGSNYATRNMKAMGWSAQRLNFIDLKNGRVSAEYLLDLEG